MSYYFSEEMEGKGQISLWRSLGNFHLPLFQA